MINPTAVMKKPFVEMKNSTQQKKEHQTKTKKTPSVSTTTAMADRRRGRILNSSNKDEEFVRHVNQDKVLLRKMTNFEAKHEKIISAMNTQSYDSHKPSKCICKREPKTVWCVMCGFHTTGNVVAICPTHDEVLEGLFLCGNPSCRTPRYLTETDW